MVSELHLCWAVALFWFLDHTHTHPVRLLWTEGQHNKQTTNIRVPSGIRVRDPSRRGTADPRLRPHGHRDQPFLYYTHQNRKSAQPHFPRIALFDSAVRIRPALCRLPGCQRLSGWESPLAAAFGPKPNLFLAQSKRDLTRSVRVSRVEATVRYFGSAVELLWIRVRKYTKKGPSPPPF
jgi:hypothetical protein